MSSVHKHGHFSDGKPSLTYSSWDAMIGRCYRTANASYPAYGARGITVCDRWRVFSFFLEDMGPRPSKEHQIERVNSEGNYTPANCRWATRSEQARNRRSSLMLTFNGETLPAIAWAERLGIPAHTIWTRKHRGWSDERALSQPRQAYPLRIQRSRHVVN